MSDVLFEWPHGIKPGVKGDASMNFEELMKLPLSLLEKEICHCEFCPHCADGRDRCSVCFGSPVVKQCDRCRALEERWEWQAPLNTDDPLAVGCDVCKASAFTVEELDHKPGCFFA